jgi:hypothetical protein
MFYWHYIYTLSSGIFKINLSFTSTQISILSHNIFHDKSLNAIFNNFSNYCIAFNINERL